MRRIVRGGEHFRVADPQWNDPLDGSYSRERGGRWNSPGSFSVLYLCADRQVARANARLFLTKRLEGLPITAEDLEPSELPVLVPTQVPEDEFLDVVTPAGCADVGLPETYPLDARGSLVGWDRCQPVGQGAFADGVAGVACRSAAPGAPVGGEELARIDRVDSEPLQAVGTERFEEWYGEFDW
jgi:RES domain